LKKVKLLRKALSGTKNFRFAELCQLAKAVGYRLDRINGSHHIFVHARASRPLNIQDVHGQAKPYQVRQLLRDIEEFNLHIESDE
jgi:predicted RNA binding protein YcfA (HicA-like mRNA interferase family)